MRKIKKIILLLVEYVCIGIFRLHSQFGPRNTILIKISKKSTLVYHKNYVGCGILCKTAGWGRKSLGTNSEKGALACLRCPAESVEFFA